ncbi:MAG TPA: NUDIX domain-containing protein [Chitinophagaceae bacterium]|nr:NUDIX domain-containing protein [Chitinophagaceae bacterium]
METKQEIKHFLEKGYFEYRQGLCIDCAIFGYHAGELQLLLVKNKIITRWCLPGGYVKKTENLDDAAARITRDRTGIEGLYLQQFKTFGEPGRNKSYGYFDEDKLHELTGVRLAENNWLRAETVSVGFYAITDVVNTIPKADFLSSECRWFPIAALPNLGFDHDDMVRDALQHMRVHLYHYPIGKNLLPKRFTLKEIKLFYEVMSGKTLSATNFPSKLIALGLIVKTREKLHIGAHRSPTYYQFNEKVYQKALREGLVFV